MGTRDEGYRRTPKGKRPLGRPVRTKDCEKSDVTVFYPNSTDWLGTGAAEGCRFVRSKRP